MAWSWRRWLPERKGYSTLELFRDIFGGRESKSGRIVNLETALKVSTVFCCLRVLADGVAQVPWKLLRTNGRNIVEAEDHPLYSVLYRRPNEWQTSFEYRETVMFHAALGNHYSYINRVRGEVAELIPFDPGQVTVKRYPDWRREFIVRAPDGAVQTFPQEAIWHVRGPSWNGWIGLDILNIAREVLGLSMAMEDQQSALFKNGVQASGTYSVEGALNDDQHAKLTKWIKEHHEGPDNAGKALVLDRAAKWLQKTMSNVDAQTLESRRYQVEEVCRAFRVMPIMVGFSDKTATYASAEQMFLAHVVHTLSPWYERLQQSCDVNLLSKKDQKAGLYSKLIVQGLLRGALKDTASYIKELTTIGVMTRNEARAKLDMNPLDGLDEPLTPANIVGNTSEPSDTNPKEGN
jgi:HK97 family phage portal protein